MCGLIIIDNSKKNYEAGDNIAIKMTQLGNITELKETYLGAI